MKFCFAILFNARRISPLAYGALLLALASYKVLKYWRENGFRRSAIFRVLLTDQALFYFL